MKCPKCGSRVHYQYSQGIDVLSPNYRIRAACPNCGYRSPGADDTEELERLLDNDMEGNYKIVALMGEAGSGKDTIMQEVLRQYPDKFNEIISCTSRPPREGEKNGKNYYFMSDEEFLGLVSDNTMLEWTNFNNWYYGTSKKALSKAKVNIGVFNPAGVKQLIFNPDVDVTVYYVRTDGKTRLLRQLNREQYPNIKEIIRRYSADEKDFSNVQDIPYAPLVNEKETDLGKCAVAVGTKTYN